MRKSISSLVRRPRRLIERITILRCHRDRAVGRGLRTALYTDGSLLVGSVDPDSFSVPVEADLLSSAKSELSASAPCWGSDCSGVVGGSVESDGDAGSVVGGEVDADVEVSEFVGLGFVTETGGLGFDFGR